jgi:soluble lytic murein transglycosylase-like protein
VKRWCQKRAIQLGLLVVLALVCLNGAVAHFGETSVFPLSIHRTEDKLAALSAYFQHHAGHMTRRDPVDIPALLKAASKRYRLPESFVLAIAHVESRLGPHRISPAGAMGIMQLMPETAAALGVVDPFDPHENIDGGARYLRRLWKRYRGNRARVAAAYNTGPGRVPVVGPLDLPRETRIYVHRVLLHDRKPAKKAGVQMAARLSRTKMASKSRTNPR